MEVLSSRLESTSSVPSLSLVKTEPGDPSQLNAGHQSLLSGAPDVAIKNFIAAGQQGAGLWPHLEFNLELAKRRWLRTRVGQSPRVAVCGWELAHNPAGRVMTLVEAYQAHASVEIIGCLLPAWGRKLWAPIRSTTVPCHSFIVEDESLFIRQALELVVAHPYDIVHLSKPRLPNIVFGLLYQLVWGARVIMDVDDEELGFTDATTPLNMAEYVAEHGAMPALERLSGSTWTRLAVGLADKFDGITVSNPALQQRYGGAVIPHVRPLTRFEPSPVRTAASRARFGVPLDKKVVLFYGTPRQHKGLLETAEALAQLGRDDICYVVVGDFPKRGLKDQLQAIEGVDCYFVGSQPYEAAADIVAMGDYCVLLQDTESLAAQFQVPAKLTDALSMGLIVFAQTTPALENLKAMGAFIPVTHENFTQKMREHLQGQGREKLSRQSRRIFAEYLSVEALAPTVSSLLAPDLGTRKSLSWHGKLEQVVGGQFSPLLAD